jgi:hypothetical protein
MSSWILDAAGYVTGTFDGPGARAGSTSVPPPANAARPLRFVNGVWELSGDVSPLPRILSQLAFLRRFTATERQAVRNARPFDTNVDDFLMLVTAARQIDLDDPDAQGGIAYLQAKSLLTSARAEEILNADITEAERP